VDQFWEGRSPARVKLLAIPVSRLSQYGFGSQIIPKPENQHGDQDGSGKQGDGPEDSRIEI
jgi:hypothetical protein